MIAYSLHGSSTKLAGTAGAAVESARLGKKPDIVIGVSGGAVLAIPFALGLYDEVLHYSANFKLKDFFDVVPVTKSGKPTIVAILRLLWSFIAAIFGFKSFHSLGIQNTKKTLEKILTKERFEEYKNGNYADCYIVSVLWKNGKVVVRNAKELDYKTALAAIESSNQLTISAQGVRVNGIDLEFDGGLRTQNASWWLLKNIKGIQELISIYVYPKGDNELAIPEKEEPRSIMNAAMGTVEIQQMDNYAEEWKDEKEFCDKNGIVLHDLYLQLVLQSKYDTNPIRLKYLQDLAILEARKHFTDNGQKA